MPIASSFVPRHSNQPVVSTGDLKRSVHVNTRVGPKTLDGYELRLNVADMANIIAGSVHSEQTRAYASPFFLNGSGNEDHVDCGAF